MSCMLVVPRICIHLFLLSDSLEFTFQSDSGFLLQVGRPIPDFGELGRYFPEICTRSDTRPCHSMDSLGQPHANTGPSMDLPIHS